MQTERDQIHNKMENRCQCTNMQEMGNIEKCNINTESIPNSNSRDNLMAIENTNSKITISLQAHKKKLIRKKVQNWHNSYIESSKMCSWELGVLIAYFNLHTKPNSKPYQAPKACILQITKTIQGRNKVATVVGHHHTTRCV